MKLLNRIANSRFSNIEAISFLATEKNTASRKNLKEIKSELNDMDNIRGEYRKA
jgi:archaellum biogenesis protein FlaJ (TadC family)